MNTKFDPQKADKLIGLCAQSPNMSMLDLGLAVGISRRTLQVWLRRGLEAKCGKYFQLVEAIQKSRAQLRVFVAGRHHVLSVGGTLQTPKKRVLLDDHNRPYVDPNNEVERRWEGGDPKCDHADHDLGRCPCGAVGEIVYIETGVLPNASNLQWEMERLMPEQNPTQHVEHHGRIEVEHSQAPMETWIERMGLGFAMLKETLHESQLGGVLDTMSSGVPGVGEKSRAEVRKAIERIATKAIETTATVISDKTDFSIEMNETEDGTGEIWEKIGDQTASSPESACRAFLVAYCHGRLAESSLTPEKKREAVSRLVSKLLRRVRAEPRTVEGAT